MTAQMPRRVHSTTNVRVEEIVDFPDNGLRVQAVDDEWIVNQVHIEYRWSTVERLWRFENAWGMGVRVMPGTGYRGSVVKRVDAMHPDYRVLAQEHAPRWRPPEGRK